MNEGLIFAAVLVLVAGFALAIGYLWGSHNGVNAVVKELNENPLLTVNLEDGKDELHLKEFYENHPIPTPAAGKMQDGLLGEITVYREFLPRYDAMEFTVYFKENGVKQRMDFRLKSEELETVHADDMERYVEVRMHQNYAEGNFAPAEGYVKV